MEKILEKGEVLYETLKTHPIQKLFRNIGSSGCLFLSVVHGCGLDLKAFEIALDAIRKKAMDEECYILDHHKLSSVITKWLPEGSKLSYVGAYGTFKEGFVNIGHFKATNPYSEHFVLMGPNGVLFDPLGMSKTVQRGRIIDFRRYLYENN